MYGKIKQRVHDVLENSERDLIARSINAFIVVLIILNVLSVIFETVESLYASYSSLFWTFEVVSVAIFSVEYLARLWACNCDSRYKGLVAGRIRYMLSPMALVDLVAILPFYLPVFISLDLRFLRALRLFRLFRMFKLVRYSESLNMLGRIIRGRKEDLFITVFIVVIVLILSSTMMYYAEHEAQPDKFDNIPDAMYWGIITLATVGYGDIYPVTALGRFFSAIIAMAGIAMFALPAGIIGSSFIEERQKLREKQMEQEIETDIEKALETDIDKALERIEICPHCGKPIREPPAAGTPPAVEKPIAVAPLKKK